MKYAYKVISIFWFLYWYIFTYKSTDHKNTCLNNNWFFSRFLQEILRNSRISRFWKSNLYLQTHITQNGQNRKKIIFKPAESRLLVNSNQVSKSLIDADQKSQRNLITLGKIPRLRSEFSNISLRCLISIVNDTKGWNQFSRSILTFFQPFSILS